MNLLKEKARNIQFEAFHVFKVISSDVGGCNDGNKKNFNTINVVLFVMNYHSL